MSANQDSYPGFYAQVPGIRLHDPLADFLGAAEGGFLDYGYADAVKLAGHSCPTVASAYGLTRLSLLALYGPAVPVRGGIRAAFGTPLSEGVTGVIAGVVSLLTGAAAEGGFKGLAGQFRRQGLLAFGAELPLQIRFTRLDTGDAVDAAAYPGRVPGAPEMAPLLSRCLAGEADADERRQFGLLWQDRVRRLLLEHGEDPAVFVVRRAS